MEFPKKDGNNSCENNCHRNIRSQSELVLPVLNSEYMWCIRVTLIAQLCHEKIQACNIKASLVTLDLFVFHHLGHLLFIVGILWAFLINCPLINCKVLSSLIQQLSEISSLVSINPLTFPTSLIHMWLTCC